MKFCAKCAQREEASDPPILVFVYTDQSGVRHLLKPGRRDLRALLESGNQDLRVAALIAALNVVKAKGFHQCAALRNGCCGTGCNNRALAPCGHQRAVMARLDDSDPSVVRAAWEALVAMGAARYMRDKSRAKQVMALLHDSNELMREFAVVALFAMEHIEAATAVVNMLEDESWDVVMGVVDELAFVCREDTPLRSAYLAKLPAVVDKLLSPDSQTRLGALWALHSMSRVPEVRGIAKVAVEKRINDDCADVRGGAVICLVTLCTDLEQDKLNLTRALLSRLDDSNAYVREQVVLAMADAASCTGRHGVYVKALLGRLDDDDVNIRAHTISALRSFHPRFVRPHLPTVIKAISRDSFLDENSQKWARPKETVELVQEWQSRVVAWVAVSHFLPQHLPVDPVVRDIADSLAVVHFVPLSQTLFCSG